MNLLKSMFIGIYPMLAMGAAGYSVFQLVNNGLSLGWIGALLSTAPMMLIIMMLMMFKNQARTSAHFPLVTILGIAGFGMAIFEYFQASQAEAAYMQASVPTQQLPLTLLISGLGLLTFLIYNFWYSSLGRADNNNLAKGQQLPEFEVLDVNSVMVSSNSFLGNPNVIVFFRGNWCPLCMAQIKEIVSQYKELDALGAKVKFISPQPEANTAKLSKQHGLNLDFYTDKYNKAAKILGIEMKNGLPMGMQMLGYDSDTALPTVIITDANGKIIHLDETDNYRIRPEPEDFIKVLKINRA